MRTSVGNLIGVGITGLLTVGLPRYLTGVQYGEWQMYQFFCLYLGYITFGVTDGVFVRAAATHQQGLKNLLLGSQSRVYGLLLAATLCIAAVGFAGFSSNPTLTLAFAIACLATWFFCLRTFVTIVWQAQRLTTPFATVVVLERLATFVICVGLIAVGIRDVIPLLVADLIGKMIALAWCIARAHGIPYTVGPTVAAKREFLVSCRVGLPLLIANLAAASIYGVVRLYVQSGWGIDVFGRISLSLTLANMALVAINSVSVVLVPALKTSIDLGESLRRVSRSLVLPASVILLAYFPLRLIIELVVPNPEVTLQGLAVLFPLCVFELRMRIVGGSFLRVTNQGRALMAISLGGVVAGTVLFAIPTAFGDLQWLLLTFVGIVALRSVAIEVVTARAVGSTFGRNAILEICIVVFFLFCATRLSPWHGVLVYLALPLALILWAKRSKEEQLT